MNPSAGRERVFDLSLNTVRELNRSLHRREETAAGGVWRVANPRGAHAIACGISAPVEVRIEGHAGYYCAGMNQEATVILNGKKIIDNQPILGCTGGAMTSDEMKPGPLMLQGDHTTIDYRNIVLKPVIK